MARAPDQHQTFTTWMTDHRGIVIKIVRSFTRQRSDAEDLTQDIDLAIWRSIPSFRGEAKPSTWIWRIALNQAISWQRSERGDSTHLDETNEPVSLDRADAAVGVNRIFDAIRTLAPVDRSLIMLALEGHRYAEMAEITGLSETNVGARLSRARSRLDQMLNASPTDVTHTTQTSPTTNPTDR